MKKDKEITYKVVSNTLKKRFLPAIILITLIILVEQVMIHIQLSNCENLSHTMNDAGSQTTLSQRITKDVLLLYNSTELNPDTDYLQELKESVATLEKSHMELLNGNHETKILEYNSNEVLVLFLKVQTNYELFLKTSKELIKMFERYETDVTLLEPKVTLILEYEGLYHDGMLKIVNQYESEYIQEIDETQRTKFILFLIIYIIILFEIIYLFMPASKFLVRIFRELKEAHENINKVFQNAHEVLILVEKKDYNIMMMSNLAKEYFLHQTGNETTNNLNENLNDNWKKVQAYLEMIQTNEELDSMEITLEFDEGSEKTFLLSTSNETFQNKDAIIVTLFDITSQKLAEETLRKIAIKDELTGLYNRHFLDTIIEEEFERSERYNYPISLVILDLDHFKRVNDTWGHPVGDLVLIQTAEVVSKTIRRSDYLIRFGGEEFLLLMPHTHWKDALIVAEKIRHAIELQPHPIAGTYTASLGVTQRVLEESFQTLYEHADAALYRAKNEGRNRVALYELPIDQKHSLLSIEWKSEWNSEDSKIDEQHKKLLSFASEILSLSNSLADNQREETLIALLIQHISHHFEYEECVLKSVGYRDYIGHATVHKKLLEKVEKLQIAYRKQEVGITEFLTFLIDEVVIGHLFDADTQFFPYLREKLNHDET